MSKLDVTFKDVELRWKNFSGRADDFNPEGKRYFNVVLTKDMVDYLSDVTLTTKSGRTVKGANVKTRVPQNGEGDPLYTLRVLFGAYPPDEMWCVTSRGKMKLNMETVANLDREYIEKAKVMVTLSPYERPGNVGITAYLKKLIVWVKEDDFDSDDEFQNLPEIGAGYSGPTATQDDEDDLPF
jgi:hypothetical protein